jgi:ribosomal protein S18 acetylase RimI-like enzyme
LSERFRGDVILMPIRLATLKNIDAVMALVKDCIQDMESQGIFQWNEHYPTIEIFCTDIYNSSLYILIDDNESELLGILTIDEEQSPEYSQLSWGVQSEKVLVIHRLAVNPKRQGRGIGGRLVDFAESYAMKYQYASIRLDAYSGNPRALKLYERRGYQKVGQLFFPYRELPFYAYEKGL